MKKLEFKFFPVLLVTLLLLPTVTKAAGILGVCSGGDDLDTCLPSQISFPAYPINNNSAEFFFKVDPGPLGDINNSSASDSVDVTLAIWEAASNLDFKKSGNGKISVDVNKSNFNEFLNPTSPLGYSPIVFDNDGTIVNELLGQGAKDSVLGFAGAIFFKTVNGKVTSIAESQSLFNGFLYSLNNRPEIASQSDLLAEFQTTILHEFAHMVGLDHSQGGEITAYINDQNPNPLKNAVTALFDPTRFPIMFPVAVNPLLKLQRDDISAIAINYPKNNFPNSFGIIKGELHAKGLPINGANIIAYNTSDPLNEVVTSASDVNGQGNGAFVLPGLIPGSYILKIEPIFEDFTSGSAVGLHPPGSASLIPTGFYQGENQDLLLSDTLNDGLNQALRLEVSGGGTIKDIIIDTGTLGRTFQLDGKAINGSTFLNITGNTKSRIRVRKIGSGTRVIKLSTAFPNLISFKPSNIVFIRKNRRSASVRVTLSSLLEFQQAFPDILSDGATIPVTAEDVNTGFIDESQSLFAF